MKRLQSTTLMLLMGAIALAVICVSLLWRGTQTNALLSTMPKPVAMPELATQFPSTTTTDFATVRLRAVFYASRGYYIAPPPSAIEPPLPKPNYRLTGTLTMPNKPMVALLLQEDTKVTSKVAVGDTLDIWQIKNIEANRVVLQHGTQIEALLKGGLGSSAGLTIQSLSRSPNAAVVIGHVQLGQGGVSGVQVMSAATANRPRFYRPPPN